MHIKKYLLLAVFFSLIISNNIVFGQTTIFSENFSGYAADATLTTTSSNWRALNAVNSTNALSIHNNGACVISGYGLTCTDATDCNYNSSDDCNKIAYYTTAIDATTYSGITLDFDWKGTGDVVGASYYDYWQVVTCPGTADPKINSNWTTVGSTKYAGSAATQNVTGVNLSSRDNSTFYIGFRWIADREVGGAVVFIDNIVVKANAAPSNDDCSGAIALSVNSTCNYTSATSAGASQSIAGCSGTADDDVWFSFVALATTATVTVDPSATYNAAFELRSGACNGSQIAGSCTNAGGNNVNETYAASGLTIGNTYYIRVWHSAAGYGSSTFDICVYSNVTACTNPISIDGCGSAYAQTFSESGSGAWSGSICSTFPAGGKEKVYTFVPTTTGTHSIIITSTSNSSSSDIVDYAWKSSCTQTGWTCIDDILNTGTVSVGSSWTAGSTYYILLSDENSTLSSQTFYIQCPAVAGSNIDLSDNGTQVSAANVGKGTTDNILHKFKVVVTGANTTLTGMQCVTAGTSASADITNLKVRYSTNSALDAADATLSTYTTPGVAGTKTFPAFSSQVITSGSTGYIFITADIAAGATTNNTIRVNTVTTSHLTFSTGTKTGTTSTAGYQTIVASVTPNIALSDNGTVAAANVKRGTSNHTLIKIALAITTNDATLTGLQATTAGTYASADLTHLKVWYSANSTLDEFDEVLSTYATPGTAGTKTFPAFIPKTMEVGTTGYIFITGYIAPAATIGNTVRVNAITTAQLTFASGTKSGSCSNGGYQTIIAYTNAYDDISMAATLSNTNYLPQAGATWTTYSNSSATVSDEPSAPPSWTVAPTRTLWFKFTATTTAQSVSTNYDAAASAVTNTRIAIYSSSDNTFAGELTLIGENENLLLVGPPHGADFNITYWNGGSPTSWHAAVTVTGLTVGNTYFVRVDGSTTGNFRIATNTAPENDACETATDMVLNTVYSVDNTSATIWSNLNQPDAAFEITPGLTSQENLIFFKFRPGATDTYYVNQSAASCDGTSNTGTQFLVFEASIDCDNIPTLITGYDVSKQLYSSGTTTSARAIPLSLTAFETYYFAIDGGRGDECAFTLRITKTWPYPIELETFQSVCNNSYEVELKWETATEMNNDYFTIEKSRDGINYFSIGKLPGAGNSSVSQHYSYVDRDPIAGVSYYRIKQTDFNGETQTFSPIAVDCGDENDNFSMHVNGNLLDGSDRISVALRGAADKRVLLVLTDIYGRELYSTLVIENSDSYIYNIKPNSDIPAGLYVITASSNDKYVSKKIIVK